MSAVASNLVRVAVPLVGATTTLLATGGYVGFRALKKPVEKGALQCIRESADSALSYLGPRWKVWTAATIVAGGAIGAAIWRGRKSKLPLMYTEDYVSETVIQGSAFTSRAPPRCQVGIAVQGPGGLEVVGNGIRAQGGLWVPSHVIGCHQEIFMVTQAGQRRIPQPLIADAIDFGVEMKCVMIPDAWFSELQVRTAKFGILPDVGTVCTLTAYDGTSSMGDLRPSKGQFGMVKYEASSKGGHSGAAYMSNNQVVGIHLHGGARGNGGQEIMYLNSAWKIETDYVDEDSADFFNRFLNQGQEFEYSEVRGKLIVRDTEGRYHVAQGDVITRYRAAKKKWAESPEDWGAEVDYDEAKGEYLAAGYTEESAVPFLVKRPRTIPLKDSGTWVRVESIPNTEKNHNPTRPFNASSVKYSLVPITSTKPKYFKNRQQRQKRQSAPSSSKQEEQQRREEPTTSQQ